MQNEKLTTPYYMISEDLNNLSKSYTGRILKLCSNESPLGTNPNVIRVVEKELKKIYLYPDSESSSIKKIIANQLDLDISTIIFGNGSTELIDLTTQDLFYQGGNAIISEYSYPLYEMLVKKCRGTVKIVPMNDWEIDLASFLDKIDNETKAIYLANPNNPTSSWVSFKHLQAFIEHVPKHIKLVIDEAYGEYLEGVPGYKTLASLTQKYNNLIVTKTFSKVYGLAGLRVGYAIVDSEFVQKIRLRKQSTNVNIVAQIAALTAYQDLAYKAKVVFEVKKNLQLMTEKLTQMKIKFVAKNTNFLLIKTLKPALQVYKELLQYGIVIQPMNFYNLPNYIRVSIGKEKDMLYLLSVLPEVMRSE
jgi:histidinol-phosphate aminotransferase